jgi:divalent metal cation (Fe/Co/Zn/Cd) transporter
LNTKRFVSLHLLVPGDWTVKHGHDLAEQIEQQIRDTLSKSTVFTHLEPKEDIASYADQDLERPTSFAQPGATSR